MDYREQVFEMLGVKPYEEFYVKNSSGKFIRSCSGEGHRALYRITEKLQLQINRNDEFEQSNFPFYEIILGDIEIVKIPKKIKLTKYEQIAIDYARLCGYKWLVRDKNEDYVKAYTEKPIKNKKCWLWESKGGWMIIRIPISFLSWEDTEPYYIGGEEE